MEEGLLNNSTVKFGLWLPKIARAFIVLALVRPLLATTNSIAQVEAGMTFDKRYPFSPDLINVRPLFDL